MQRTIPQSDRWIIANCSLITYLTKDGNWSLDESEAMIFPSSFDASQKSHSLKVSPHDELEILPLDPSPSFGTLNQSQYNALANKIYEKIKGMGEKGEEGLDAIKIVDNWAFEHSVKILD